MCTITGNSKMMKAILSLFSETGRDHLHLIKNEEYFNTVCRLLPLNRRIDELSNTVVGPRKGTDFVIVSSIILG